MAEPKKKRPPRRSKSGAKKRASKAQQKTPARAKKAATKKAGAAQPKKAQPKKTQPKKTQPKTASESLKDQTFKTSMGLLGYEEARRVLLKTLAKAESKGRQRTSKRKRPSTAKAGPSKRALGNSADNRAAVLAKAQQALRKEGEALLEKARRLKSHLSRDFFELGSVLHELQKPAYHRALGHKTFVGLLRERKLVGPATAYKLIAIAEAYQKEQALPLGVEKAYGLVQLSRLVAPDASPASLLEENIRVDGVLLRDMPARAVQTLVKRARLNASPVDLERVTVTERVLKQAKTNLKKRGISDATVTVRYARGGPRLVIELDPEDAANIL